MVTRSTETSKHTRGKELGPVVRSVGGLMLALVVVAGIGGRHLAREGGDTDAATVQIGSAAVQSARDDRRDAGTRNEARTLYIVGSEDEAARIHVALTEMDRVRAGFGTPPVNAEIVVIDSADAETTIMQATAELDFARLSMGLPGITLTDLRAGK